MGDPSDQRTTLAEVLDHLERQLLQTISW